MSEERFVVHDSSVEDYFKSMQTKNTKQRQVYTIAAEVAKYLATFIRSVERKDGEDYEASSPRSLMAHFERYIVKKNNYPASIIHDRQLTRKSRQSKQKGSLTRIKPDEEIQVLCDSDLLGVYSAEYLQNIVLISDCEVLRSTGVCRDWVDVKLCTDPKGNECLEYTERQKQQQQGRVLTSQMP